MNASTVTTILLTLAILVITGFLIVTQTSALRAGAYLGEISHPHGSSSDESMLTISGTGERMAQLFINSFRVIPQTTGDFNHDLTLAPGLNTITFDLYDKFGKHTRESITIWGNFDEYDTDELLAQLDISQPTPPSNPLGTSTIPTEIEQDENVNSGSTEEDLAPEPEENTSVAETSTENAPDQPSAESTTDETSEETQESTSPEDTEETGETDESNDQLPDDGSDFTAPEPRDDSADSGVIIR